MNKKLFLTSIFAIAFACPAFAVDGNATIENGDTCNIDNLGTSENNSTANIEAIWTLQSINCPAGTSFNASTASCDTCSAGSWCVAGSYDVENNQTGAGATLCSTLSNGDYPLSESGSSANTACYRNCANADVDHATQVSGAYYYGDNNQCSATECAAGWHVKPGVNLATKYNNSNITDSSEGRINYPNIDNNYSSNFSRAGTYHDATYYGISEAGEWGKDFSGFGILKGKALCSTQQGYRDQTNHDSYEYNNPTTFTNLTDETGQNDAYHCYCKLTGYKDSNSNIWETISMPWVYINTGTYTGDCDRYCVADCSSIGNNFAQILLSFVAPSLATCEANNIALQWYNDTVANEGTKITPNNDAANQCTYNETITVPTNEMQKPGYTFGGWKLRTNN